MIVLLSLFLMSCSKTIDDGKYNLYINDEFYVKINTEYNDIEYHGDLFCILYNNNEMMSCWDKDIIELRRAD